MNYKASPSDAINFLKKYRSGNIGMEETQYIKNQCDKMISCARNKISSISNSVDIYTKINNSLDIIETYHISLNSLTITLKYLNILALQIVILLNELHICMKYCTNIPTKDNYIDTMKNYPVESIVDEYMILISNNWCDPIILENVINSGNFITNMNFFSAFSASK